MYEENYKKYFVLSQSSQSSDEFLNEIFQGEILLNLESFEDSMGRKEEIQMEMIISECKETINNRLANGLDLDINK